jgi:hypothetical protein
MVKFAVRILVVAARQKVQTRFKDFSTVGRVCFRHKLEPNGTQIACADHIRHLADGDSDWSKP